MTDPTAAGQTPAAPTPWVARLTAALVVLAAFLLTRPYFGIRHDARIYVGRAEADLGRNGMAESLMFAHDGQSRFSIFGGLFRPIVEHLGSSTASMTVTLVGLAFWLVAVGVLLSRIIRGAQLWAAALAVAALPAFYISMLAYAEPFATPRLFAEALICLALAAVLRERWVAAVGCALLAAAIHPIMAAPGLAMVGLMLGFKDRRWFAVAAAGLAVVLAAAFAGLPLFERLVTPIDAAWLQMLQQRSAYLFPDLWSENSWLLLWRQLLTLVIAASLLKGRVRQLIVAVLVVGLAGVAATIAAPTLLVIQVQPWRGLWLVALLATALLPIVIAQLWDRDNGGRAAAALLAIAWGVSDPPYLAAVAGALALVFSFLPQARRLPTIGWRIAWVAAGLLLLRSAGVLLLAAVTSAQAIEFNHLITRMLLSQGLGVVAGVIAVVVLLRSTRACRAAARPWAVALAAILTIVSIAVWDAQSDWTRARDGSTDVAALRSQLPTGEVFWLGSDGRSGPWTDRAEWWSVNEGASSVFDRTLAMEWARRHDVLVDAGLATRRLEMVEVGDRARPKLSATALAQICRAARGPAAIIAPFERTTADVRPLASGEWRAPASPSGRPADALFLIFRCETASAQPD